MLARLQAIAGVRSSFVDVTGAVFLVTLEPGALHADVQCAIAGALARDARRLTPDEVRSEIAPLTRREPWFGLEDLPALSYIECRIVAARVASSVERELRLGRAATEELTVAVREEMFAHVDRIHAGLFPSGRFLEAWPDIVRRAVSRCPPGVSDQGEAVLGVLLSTYQR